MLESNSRNNKKKARLAVDIGGTFTDVALELPGTATTFVTAKTPTTPRNPVEGAMQGVRLALEQSGISPAQVSSFIHGTTLATNALIEKKGATVGVIATQGFRDILEIAYERRYNQYDILLDKPDMLVPRERCLTVPERMLASGEVLEPLEESGIDELLAKFDALEVNSLAVGLLHSYANPAHEQRLAELISAKRPDWFVSLSSEVSPEAREYDRLCTTVANAYVQPLMATYLREFANALAEEGFDCPLYAITSGGGMTTFETAIRFPIRLVESGPSGGAVLAAKVAEQCGLECVVSFDMGGTTAKVCLIDDGLPQTSRHFEVARAERFLKGSGLPVRIPVIEMIEIGAGGGSVAGLDRLGRITVGPESAGSEPGPACFARGGQRATVTDADVTLGYIVPDAFAEGRLRVDVNAAETAVSRDVGQPMQLEAEEAAHGVSQIVDENMASAGRVHAVEHGKSLNARTMIAFGGNGPLHATRVAEKMGVSRIVIPPDPGVGSAIGFLAAPVSYELVRSHYTTLRNFDFVGVNGLLRRMSEDATKIVERGANGQRLNEVRTAFIRYKGQGHEIEVPLPARDLTENDLPQLVADHETAYRAQFHRSVPEMVIEVMSWSLTVSTEVQPVPPILRTTATETVTSHQLREVYFGSQGGRRQASVFFRKDLVPGNRVEGPALIVEAQTTALVAPDFEAEVDGGGNLFLLKTSA